MKYIINPKLTLSFKNDECVILDIESENYIVFDAIASTIFKLFENAHSIEEAITFAGLEFEGDPLVIKQESKSFIEKLIKDQYIILV
jgi:hypothetical protein